MIYLKACLASLVASFLVVVAILVWESIKATNLKRAHPGALVATAGTYSMALHSPVVQILIVVVFAVAFYITAR